MALSIQGFAVFDPRYTENSPRSSNKEYSGLAQNQVASGAVMFTDIVGSSKLWKEFPELMAAGVERHENLITQLIANHKGMVIKTIGDAIMAKFPILSQAIHAAISIQNSLERNNQIRVGDKYIRVRIGIAAGSFQQRTIKIQNCPLIDIFGTTVNTASRCESKVASPGGFAIATPCKLSTADVNMLHRTCTIEAISFQNDCSKLNQRSERLVSNLKVSPSCANANDLHGVGETLILTCKLR